VTLGCPDCVFEVFQPANGNNLMILHIHKDRTDSLNRDEIGNDFIDKKETRVTPFGKFT